MFTGIVQSLGTVKSVNETGQGRSLVVDLGTLDKDLIKPGDSIAVNGACLTVIDLLDNQVCFDVSAETLSRCLIGEWVEGIQLNLELALTLQTPLGGHLVSGHIDGTGVLLERKEVDTFTRMQFEVSGSVGRLIAVKGSVTVDGVSLTTNGVLDDQDQTRFDVMLVPHTLEVTTLGSIQPGARVHLEADLVARYLQRLLDSQKSG